jgi:GNAT superfamily N-acetyltransferase
MRISQADDRDLPGLARLLWLDTFKAEPLPALAEEFEAQLGLWWQTRSETHFAFVARLLKPEIVGMAWIALVPRVPRPGAIARASGDVQAVFVLPEHRGLGIGSALVEAASQHAEGVGTVRVTVHSGRRAVSVYNRLGFASSPQLLQRPPGE